MQFQLMSQILIPPDDLVPPNALSIFPVSYIPPTYIASSVSLL